jgi:hypothetical protein
VPVLNDLIGMFRKLTGREPDQNDVARARAVVEAGKARRKKANDPP